MDSLNVRVILLKAPFFLVTCGAPTIVGPGPPVVPVPVPVPVPVLPLPVPADTEKVPTVAFTALPARSVGRAEPNETVYTPLGLVVQLPPGGVIW